MSGQHHASHANWFLIAAVCFSFAGAFFFSFTAFTSVNVGRVAVPVGLAFSMIGAIGGFTVNTIRGLEKRIRALEQELKDRDRED